MFPYSIHTSGNLPFGTLCQAWQLTCASSSQQRRKGSSLQHCLSPAPNAASHTTQFTGTAAPRGGRKSRQTPWQIPTACKSALHFSNMHMTPCKSLLAPQWPSAQPCLHKGWGLSQLPASGTSHDFLPCSHIRPNKSYPNCIWKNNWDEIADNHKGVFQVLRTSQSGFLWLQQIQSKQRSPHDWHWGKTSDLLYMISHSADFTWGSSAPCRGRQLLQWWQPCVTQILKSASHNQ